MRFILSLILLAGLVMMLGAAFLFIDGYATEDRRAAFLEAVENKAEAHGEMSRRERRFDPIGAAARVYNDLTKGIFKSAGIDLRELLPAAPDGWTRRDYADADGTAITGAALERTILATTSTNETLLDFADAGRGGKLNARATYENGARLIALRLAGDLQTMRRAENGELRAARPSGTVFAWIDGLPVIEEPRFVTDYRGNERLPAPYRRFTIALDRQVAFEILTNAADADILALLERFDMGALQAGLPLKSHGYTAGAGFQGPEDPATEPPA